MKQKKVSFKWSKLYEAKLKDRDEAQKKSFDRIKQLYQKEDARKQSRQVKICTKVPPSSNKRCFYGGPGTSNLKSNLMKKAKVECLNSPEVKNLAAMKKQALQSRCIAPARKLGSFSGKDCASTSNLTKPMQRRL
ncbi:uncharacterized protein LOC117927349 isoform X2 [Vitis riparia]|nr:uncharacterized protein LOC117927349 isoform X2 [Vitis riparia]